MNPSVAKWRLLIISSIVVSIVLALIGIIFFVSHSNRPSTPSSVTLTVWGLEDEALFSKTFSNFTEAHKDIDLKIIYKRQNPKLYASRILNRSENVKEGERPDVFSFHNTQLLLFKELLTPVPAEILSQEKYAELFYPAAKATLSINKQVYGLPQSADGLVLYYNQALMASKNFSPPPNWETFFTIATRLTTRSTEGQPTVAGAAIGTAENVSFFSDIIGLMFLQQDNTPITNLGEHDADSIVQYYAKFARGPERVWDPAFEPDVKAFANGKVAMIFGRASTAADIKKESGSLAFGTAAVPQLREEGKSAWASFWAWGVSKRSPNESLAWELAAKLSEKASLLRANKARATLGEAELPYPRKDMRTLQPNPIFLPFFEQAEYASVLPMASQTADNLVNEPIVALLHDLLTKNPSDISDAAMRDTGTKIGEVLKQNKYTE